MKKWVRQFLEATFVVAGIVFLTIEVWRDKSLDYRLVPEIDLPNGPPLPDDEEIFDQFPTMWPIFSTRPAVRMVN